MYDLILHVVKKVLPFLSHLNNRNTISIKNKIFEISYT